MAKLTKSQQLLQAARAMQAIHDRKRHNNQKRAEEFMAKPVKELNKCQRLVRTVLDEKLGFKAQPPTLPASYRVH